MPTESFQSPFPPDAAMQLLRAEVSSSFLGLDGAFFFGDLGTNGFVVSRGYNRGGIYPIRFKGKVVEAGAGSLIQLRYSKTGWQFAAVVVGASIASILFQQLTAGGADMKSVRTTLGMGGLFALIFGGMEAMFRYELRRSKAFLMRLLDLTASSDARA